ncbi:MAG: hypothetical protein LBO75_01320, partial [Bifidobacteriaceae bacterium]|nr:hypothetical protein [Bifidobacteriaceae bacterium]
TAITGLVMAGIMFFMTHNPVWAAMPLVATLATTIPLLVRSPPKPWFTGVVGLDDAADPVLTPNSRWELQGATELVAALARRLIADSLPTQGPLPALQVPPETGWEWARFAPLPRSTEPGLTAQVTAGGLLIQVAAHWPVRPTPVTLRNHLPKESGPPGTVNQLLVRDAGLGLVAARGQTGIFLTALALGPTPLEEQIRQLITSGAPHRASPTRFPLTSSQIQAAWQANLRPPLGFSPHQEACSLDLVQDGPHALVAGTSGSGKSEFLRALILAEAVSAPPNQLAIVGLDHKGGATFRDLEHLPHVVGVATDLDAAGTARVLTSLEAELANRERLLERESVASWGELTPGERPARLLVVVDEFRILLDALPEASGRLERLAAQGRSLGMGLILATQRPAGAVSAQLRANLALRICFRVASEADSMDLLGNGSAARIDPELPGTCIVATAGKPAWTIRVSLAPPPQRRCSLPAAWPHHWEEPPTAINEPAALVGEINTAAQQIGAKPPPAPWCPPLPEQVSATQLIARNHSRVVLGLADLPAQQTQTELDWDPASGHLAILGGPKSGRTTAALTVAAGLTAAGVVTHVVTHQPAAFTALAGAECLGSVIGATDPDRLAELLSHWEPEPQALILDAATELEGWAVPAQSRSLLDTLVGSSLAPGAHLVVTGPPKPARWLSQCPHRLVLPVTALTDDLVLGVPKEMAHTRHLPGRACYLNGDTAVTVQVAWPSDTIAPSPHRLAPPHRVLELPAKVTAGDLPPDSSGNTIWVGLGGPLGTPLALPVSPGHPIAIIGPPGSGRSTTLAHLHRRLEQAGRHTFCAAGNAARSWLQVLEALEAGAIALVDDLETMPGPAPLQLPTHGTLITACNTATAAALRPPVPLLQAHPLGVILWPDYPGSATAFGLGRSAVARLELTGPRRPDPPGRGRLVIGSSSFPVQLTR